VTVPLARIGSLRCFVVLALAWLIAGCALDPLHARRATATAAAAQSHELDCAVERDSRCALASPYHELAAQALAQSTRDAPVHYVNLLERGADSLLLRVHLIRSAQHSIVVQTFIFQEDDAGTLILDELVKAARRGVAVRVIADQLFSLEDTHLLAALASAHVNFELRVYNPAFHKAATPPLEFAAGLLCCFWRFNQRMHDKMLLIDDSIGIVGGRNYENRYYDWDNAFDYRDRDVLAVGPVGVRMRAAFNAFWNDPHTVPLAHLTDVAHDILAGGIRAPAYVTHRYRDSARVEALSRQADDIDYVRAQFAGAALRVSRIDYFSDVPGKLAPEQRAAAHESTQQLMALLRSARKEIVLQTPYLVLSSAARRLFTELHKRAAPPQVIVSTNSLAATDAFYVYALSYKYKKRYVKIGFEIHEFKPFPDEASETIAGYANLGSGSQALPVLPKRRAKYSSAPLKRAGLRIGLHAKSFVIDSEIAVIGSHNFDPRSEQYNTEAGFIVHDREFASRVRAAILRDAAPGNAWTIARRERAPLFGKLSNALANISAALPIFDFWPFRYATSYEFDPDDTAACTPPPRPGAANFHACYVDVGDFPEVDLPLKTIYTRIVTAFGAGLVSIM